jgi:hypothetical protein
VSRRGACGGRPQIPRAEAFHAREPSLEVKCQPVDNLASPLLRLTGADISRPIASTVRKRIRQIDFIRDETEKYGVVSRLDQHSGASRSHIIVMMKSKQQRIGLARKIISSMKRQMQKPRLTESVHRSQEDHVASFVELSPARSKGK